MQKLEHPYKPISLTSIEENDAIVVLSGFINDQSYVLKSSQINDKFFESN